MERWRFGAVKCAVGGSIFAFVDAEFVAVGVGDDGGAAAGQVERLNGEGHDVTAEMRDGLVEVIHFQHEMRAVARGLQERFIAEAERVWANFILDPELVAILNAGGGVKPSTPS